MSFLLNRHLMNSFIRAILSLLNRLKKMSFERKDNERTPFKTIKL